MRVPIGVPAGGVWGQVRVGGGAGFLLQTREKGGWGGWGGTGKGTSNSMRASLSKLPFGKLPYGSPRLPHCSTMVTT